MTLTEASSTDPKARSQGLARTTALVAVAVAISLVAGTLVLFPLTWTDRVESTLGTAHVEDLMVVVALLAYSAVGALIVIRRPGNRVGWILVVAGVCLPLWMFSLRYAAYGLVVRNGAPGADVMAWISLWAGSLGLALAFVFLFLVFPNGHLPSPRWRPVAWFAAVAVSFITVTWATAPGQLATFEQVTNPLGIELVGRIDPGVGWLLFVLAVLASVASLVARYIGSAGVERRQLQWLAYAAALIGLSLVTVTIASSGFKLADIVSRVLFPVAIAGIPIAVGVAVLRYRLYEIDRLVNRTLVYTIVVGLLVAFYVSLVVGIPTLLPATENRDLLVAAATLAAFFLFNPLRRRVQRFVDRRFYRSRYNAERIVEDFTAHLRDQVDLNTLTEEWLAVVDETMKPTTAQVWLRATTEQHLKPET